MSFASTYWARKHAVNFVSAMELLNEEERKAVLAIKHPSEAQIWQQKWIREFERKEKEKK